MSRRSPIFAAVVAALLVVLLLAVSASAEVPRCAEDNTQVVGTATPAVLQAQLTHNGVSGCPAGQDASFGIVTRTAPSSTLAMLNNWRFIVALRTAESAEYTLTARCNGEVMCEAHMSFAVVAN